MGLAHDFIKDLGNTHDMFRTTLVTGKEGNEAWHIIRDKRAQLIPIGRKTWVVITCGGIPQPLTLCEQAVKFFLIHASMIAQQPPLALPPCFAHNT